MHGRHTAQPGTVCRAACGLSRRLVLVLGPETQPRPGQQGHHQESVCQREEGESLTVRTRSVPGAHGQCREDTVSARRLGEGSPSSPVAAEGGQVLGEDRPSPAQLLSGPFCAPRLMGTQCTRAVPAADQPQPDGQGGGVGCCPAAEAAASNCGPLRWTGIPGMRSWAPQLPQAPQGGAAGRGAGKQCQVPRVGEGVGGLAQHEPETRALACLSLPPVTLLPHL